MKRNRKAFTLIETLVVLTLITVVALLMYSFFGQGFSLYSVETESADEQMNLRQVLSEITNKARLITDRENITCSDGVLSIDDDSYTLNNEQIMRNDTIIANGISVFNVSINDDILEIGITNTASAVITTSISLPQQVDL